MLELVVCPDIKEIYGEVWRPAEDMTSENANCQLYGLHFTPLDMATFASVRHVATKDGCFIGAVSSTFISGGERAGHSPDDGGDSDITEGDKEERDDEDQHGDPRDVNLALPFSGVAGTSARVLGHTICVFTILNLPKQKPKTRER